MAKTVVGTFNDAREAERAAAALANDGVDRGAIHVIDNTVGRESEARWEGKSGGFWSWLFGDVASDQEDSAYYTDQLGRGAAFVTVTCADERADRIQELMQRGGAQDVHAETSGAAQMSSTGTAQRGSVEPAQRDVAETAQRGSAETAQRGSADREEVIPVVEEEMKVGKRAVQRGNVRVYTHTSERPVEEYVRLRAERIKVERRPVDRPVTGGDAFKEREIELTETEEEPIVDKQARVVEEVVVGTEVDERDQPVRGTVRRVDVDVQGGDRSVRFAAMEPDFRQHCTRSFGHSGSTYEQCSPAYRYGYELAGDRQYSGDWAGIESKAREQWETRNPGTWERFKDAIRYSWDRARGEARAA